MENHDESLWYAYVWLNNWPQADNLPEIFFVPSADVVHHMKTNHTEETKRPFFWIYEQDAWRYKGVAGLESMRKFMNSPQQLSNQPM